MNDISFLAFLYSLLVGMSSLFDCYYYYVLLYIVVVLVLLLLHLSLFVVAVVVVFLLLLSLVSCRECLVPLPGHEGHVLDGPGLGDLTGRGTLVESNFFFIFWLTFSSRC